ncbi:MAG: hypothetical protein IKN72_01815 [Clostridia bacterium]|nr:hypothetical protein [Clostridia bacterium]
MKELIKTLGYKAYIQYIFPISQNIIKYVSTFFALFGGYFTFGEILETVFNSQFLIELFRRHRIVVFVCAFVITVWRHKEKSEYMAHLENSDKTISLKLSNILNLKDPAIVVPTNTTFDTIMADDFISPKSIQGQFQTKFYGADFSSLDKQIKDSLDEYYSNSFTVLQDRTNTNVNRYDIGTVAKITKKGQHFYFLAVADINRSGKTENVTMQNLKRALNGLWDYYAVNGHNEPIAIPVIGTGKGGLYDGTLEDVVHETIKSFAIKSKEKFIAKEIIISIYPPSLSKANTTWKSLCEFLDWTCRFSTKGASRTDFVNTK